MEELERYGRNRKKNIYVYIKKIENPESQEIE